MRTFAHARPTIDDAYFGDMDVERGEIVVREHARAHGGMRVHRE